MVTAHQILPLLGIEITERGYARGSFDIPCCFCADNHEHLHIDLGGPFGRFFCRRCGESGSLLTLYGRLRDIPTEDLHALLAAIEEDTPGGMEAPQRREVAVQPEHAKLASLVTRDRVYRALFANCVLSETHKEALLQRGLSEADIMRIGYRSSPGKEDMHRILPRILHASDEPPKGVPGFFLNRDGKWTMKYPPRGILVPYTDRSGKIQCVQVRLDEDARRAQARRTGRKVGKYKWLSSSYVPPGASCGTQVSSAPHYTRDPRGAKTVMVTEGALKAEVIATLMEKDTPIIAMGGVSMTSQLNTALKYCQENGTKNVVVALDMDMYENDAVMRAVRKIRSIAEAHEIKPLLLNWSPCKGLDDFLLNRKQTGNGVISYADFPE